MKRLYAVLLLAFLMVVPAGAQAKRTQYCASVTISYYGKPYTVGPACVPCPDGVCSMLPTCLPPLCGVAADRVSAGGSSQR
jgi:hypothetical protein